MTKTSIATALCLLASIATVLGQPPKGRKQDGKPSAIVGAWQSTDRHVALASLFQPQHGVRKRQAVVHFAQDGNRLSGYAVAEDFPDRKNGRTDFRTVKFADGQLALEYDITFSKQHGPLAIESGRVGNKGTVRVEPYFRRTGWAADSCIVGSSFATTRNARGGRRPPPQCQSQCIRPLPNS
jgi:hypothetical protein